MRQILDATAAPEADVGGLVDRPFDLQLGSDFTPLIEQGIDVAIRIGTLTSSNLIA